MSADFNDMSAVIDAAVASTEPHSIDPDSFYVVTVPEGQQFHVVTPQPDNLRVAPRRKSGTTTVYDVDGLAFLWTKQSIDGVSELFADPKKFNLTAVLNADQPEGADAGHRDHRAVLSCEVTTEWAAWMHYDGKLLDQMDFAEFLEERLAEVVEPSGAQMLEIAQSFEATTKGEFKGAVTTTSGTRTLQYEETSAARAGQKGEIEIPHEFYLGLQPFEGSDRYRVKALFRYRIREGRLTIGYRIERPEVVLRNAFNDVVVAAGEACGVTPILGVAPAERR